MRRGRSPRVALVRMANIRRPGVRVLFLGGAGLERYTAGLGTFIETPVTVSDVVNAIATMMESPDPS